MKAFESVNNSVRKAVLAVNGFYRPGLKYNCKIGKVYPKPTCEDGQLCDPIEDAFVSTCGVEGCDNNRVSV